MARRSKNPSSVFLSCPAGGIPALIFEGVAFTEVERVTGKRLHELAQCVFSSSGGTLASAPLFLRDPDKPNSALRTAQEALDISKQKAAPLLKRSWKSNQVQEIITSQLGDRRMRDYFGSHLIPLHNSRARCPEDVAKLVYKIETQNGQTIYEPGIDAPVSPIVQASSAVPIRFRSVIMGEHQLSDFGHVHESARGLISYSNKSGTPRERIKYIEIGPPRYHDPSANDREGLFNGLHMLFNKTSAHSFSSSINTVREFVGEANTHLLYAQSGRGGFRGNLLNSSETSIRRLEQLTYDYLEGEGRDIFNRICDVMVENAAIIGSTKPDTFFGFRVPSIFQRSSGVKPKEKSPPPIQVAATLSGVAPA